MNAVILHTYRIDYLAYIVCIALLDLIALWQSSYHLAVVAILLAWLSMVWQAFKQLQKKRIGTEFFLVFATIVALMGRQEHAIMLVLLLMLIAQYIELLIEQRTSQAITGLIHLMPTDVIILQDHTEKIIPLAQLVPGMYVIVKTGGRVPADGFITEGQASINEAMLTGESVLKEKQKGDHVFAGTFAQAGSIVFLVQTVRQETLFGRMTALFSQAEQNKARITVFTERLSFILAPLLLTFIVIIWIMTGNINLVITLLIFGSPLELSLVTPLTVLSGSVAAFRNGILVKSGLALERLAHVDTIIFDKTGTLTLGEPVVVEVRTFDAHYTTADIIKIAGIAERRADHVVAKAILQKAQELAIDIPQPEQYASLVGHGVEMVYQSQRYFFGNKHFVQAVEHGNSAIPANVIVHDRAAYSHFFLASEGKVLGEISVTDAIRPNAKAIIQKLRDSGISTILLVSGDRQEITNHIADQLGIEKAYGEVFPDQKLMMLEQLQKKGAIVAMIGDGINDVAALKQAHVGIAMGAMGMEPAIEAADIVLMTNDLENIVFIRKLSQKVFAVIKQNLLIGFLLLHALGLVLTLAHLVSPVQAAFFHALSDIVILLNASRLTTFRVQ